MEINRRHFVGGAATAALAGCGSTQVAQAPAAPAATRSTPSQPMQRRLTYATIGSDAGWGLGLRTANGVLDVAAAERALRLGAPTTMDAVVRQDGDLAALARLAAMTGADAARFVVPESAVRFGPVMPAPPKIMCIGLNYRAHVAEANQQIPTTPIFFNSSTRR